jgi:hypothetical protein
MKMKIIGILVTLSLLLGVFALAEQEIDTSETRRIAHKLSFSPPVLEETIAYTRINTMDTNAVTTLPDEPMIPYYTKTLTFPLGTHIKDVEYTHSPIKTINVPDPIQPASRPVPADMNSHHVQVSMNNAIYTSADPYPGTWYDYNLGIGLDTQGNRVIYLTLNFFPLHYLPAPGTLQYVENAEINIYYTEESYQLNENDEYDMIIIAPQEFSSGFEPLVTHKTNHGIDTKIVTVEEIYDTYEGRDGSEKVKYFIKDAIESWNVTYILLGGGKTSLWRGNWGLDGPDGLVNDALWHVPVRYSSLDDGVETGYPCDLYFADIYKYEEGQPVFDDWDSNNNGIFAEWPVFGIRDKLDLYPDVYVGRLACRSVKEVDTMVNKIITYESSPADPSWFNNVLLIAGDTFPGYAAHNEGEEQVSHTFSYLPDQFNPVKLFASQGTLTKSGQTDKTTSQFAWFSTVVPTMSEGFGFIFCDGHASPTSLVTHHPQIEDYYVNILNTYNMDLINNGDKLPVMVVGGCHNSEFNVSFFDFLNNIWTYQPTFECWSWRLTVLDSGGNIATIGNTGLGYGQVGESGDVDGDGIDEPDCVEGLGGWIESAFSQAYGELDKDIIGETWGTAITSYINTFPCNKDKTDCKTVQEWALLGDPSLQIGGYNN